MPDDTLTLEGAIPTDWPAIQALLQEAGLPTDGMAEHLATALVVRGPEGVVACGALELYGESALLRSLAVAPARRGEGLGQRLVHALLSQARERGVRRVTLLTETAGAFFPRFGFRPIPRQEVDPAVQASLEFSHLCPESAQAFLWEAGDGKMRSGESGRRDRRLEIRD